MGTQIRGPAAQFASGLCGIWPSSKTEGAGKAGCWPHPWPREVVREVVTTGSTGQNPTFPAQWFYGFLRALPGEPGFFATIAPKKLASQELDTSIGVSGPHDFAVRLQHHSSVDVAASTASPAPRS